MRRLLAAALIVSVFGLSPIQAFSDTKPNDYKAAQQNYLKTAEKYRNQARDLQNKVKSVPSGAQKYVRQLAGVFNQLADTKVALAKAIGAKDWKYEEKLEKKYYRLKAQEEKLWSAIDRAKK
jgi:uncharacterized protein HemX